MIHVLHERRWVFVVICASALGFQFCGMSQAELLPASNPATRTSFEDVPLAPMGDQAYQILRSALDAASKDISKGDADANRAALEKLRKFIFPDFTKLQCVEFIENEPGFGFILQPTNAEGRLLFLNSDFTVFLIQGSHIPSPKLMGSAQVIDALNAYESRPMESYWRSASSVYFAPPGDAANQQAVYDFHQAIIAAELGNESTADLLMRDALKQKSAAIESAYIQIAWWSYRFGVSLLEAGCRPSLVLRLWQQSLAAEPEPDLVIQLKDYVATLQSQMPEAEIIAADKAPNPQSLSLDQRLAYYLNRFPEVHGEQFSSPGTCLTIGFGKGTEISDAVIAIGRPAMSILIEHLTDRRLTRSVGFRRWYELQHTVLRVQDVVVTCIEEISGIRFYNRTGTWLVFSTEDSDLRNAVIADIKFWWAEYENKPPIEGYIARLDKGDIYDRIDILGKIEKLDPKAVDSVYLLKKWAVGANEYELIHVAQELADRRDLSLLPAVRELAHREGSEFNEDAVWYLIRYGNVEDFRYLQNQIRQDIANGVDMNSTSWYGVTARYLTKIVVEPDSMFDSPGSEPSKFKHGENVFWVPLLMDYLSQRKSIGGRRQPDWKQEESFSLADAAMGPLIALTGHNEGYAGSDDEPHRYAAIDRWQLWWRASGREEFVREHPEAVQLFSP